MPRQSLMHLSVSTHSVADIQLDLKLMNDRVHIMAYTMLSFVLRELKNTRDLETGDEATLFIIWFATICLKLWRSRSNLRSTQQLDKTSIAINLLLKYGLSVWELIDLLRMRMHNSYSARDYDVIVVALRYTYTCPQTPPWRTRLSQFTDETIPLKHIQWTQYVL